MCHYLTNCFSFGEFRGNLQHNNRDFQGLLIHLKLSNLSQKNQPIHTKTYYFPIHKK